MRTFIAIEFEDEIKEYLCGIRDNVKINCKKGNYTEKENFHITLRFIGETSREDTELLAIAVNEAAGLNKKVSLSFGELGFFPKGDKSIVWIGIKENKGLYNLFRALEKSLGKQGFPREKKIFKPHITLGREVELFLNKEAMKKKIVVDSPLFSIKSISLMESTRINGKLVYKTLYSQNLK